MFAYVCRCPNRAGRKRRTSRACLPSRTEPGAAFRAAAGVASGELWGPPMSGRGRSAGAVPLARPTVLTDEREEAVLWKACEEAVEPFDLVFDDGAPSPTAPALEAVRVAVAEEQEAEEKSFAKTHREPGGPEFGHRRGARLLLPRSRWGGYVTILL